MAIELRPLQADDVGAIAAVNGGAAWKGDPALWTGYLLEQERGQRTVLLALSGQEPVGYGTLLWHSHYQPFRTDEIPEVNNLVVSSHARRRGIASALLAAFEDMVREKGKAAIGIGVGLYADYGAAQRLYVQLGFRPDGKGITCAYEPVAAGAQVRLDDELVLWLIKVL